MANTLASGPMIQRELLMMLPSDAKTFSEELFGDVLVKVQTCGHEFNVRVHGPHRALSMNDIRDIYKPEVDANLHAIWAAN